MIISDLNILESVEETSTIQGGIRVRNYNQRDDIRVRFDSNNNFQTVVRDPRTFNNSAAAGAKGDAQNNNYRFIPTYSFTKADTVAVAEYLGESFSASTSAAVINRAG
ncbi:hypothetical protein [Halotia branconii]|uniref:Uncharacterized protein n=1 Tax=Halotia branconii CENA392 TaxID=1539056 RepID=A0AAJ6P9R4_9CYAN|nr:hypothetical protein [Halotia branconii]WGV26006.1 hypothetical protein QI031_00325 [Halotia branconii CENA392]